MKPLQLVPETDPVLREVAKAVTTENVKRLVREMAHIARIHNGAGLAAPQVGVSLRVIILRLTGMPSELINPEWKPAEGAALEAGKEGCLTLPGRNLSIHRHTRIMVRHLAVALGRVIGEIEREFPHGY